MCVQMISYSLLCKYFRRRFCPPTRYSAPIFTGSAHGSATDAGSPLHPAAIGRSTARNAAAPSCASRRRTLPDGGAASNIKRLEILDFQGFLLVKRGWVTVFIRPRQNPFLTFYKGEKSMNNKLKTVDPETLLSTLMSKTMFIVDGLISQGVNVISGASKIGKSWLMLWLGLQVAQGNSI